MKILHVVRGLSNSSGTTHIVVPVSEEQARQGCRVSVFFVDKPNQPAVLPRPDLVESCGFRMSLPMDNPGVSLDFATAVGARVREFDVVHIHAVWNFPTWWAMRAAAKAGVPYMVAPQGSFDPWALGQNRWGKLLYGRLTELPLLKRATWLQALSVKEAEQFKRYGIDAPSVVIPNGVDTQNFQRRPPRLAQRLGLPQASKTLLFLSRLHPKKGLDVLIPAFGRFSAAHPDVTLVVVGDDAGTGYVQEVRAMIERYGVGSRCVLLGEVKGEVKYDTLLGADAFVLPSHSEGLPVAAVEAMAAGLPVVISDECNLPEVAEWNAGHVVRAEVSAVAAALGALFDDPGRAAQMGDNGKQLVQAKFTWREIARRMIAVYGASSQPKCGETRVHG